MATAQSALNGLQRSLNFVKSQLEDKKSLYSPGLAQIQEIKSLAQQILLMSNVILSKSGVEDESLQIEDKLEIPEYADNPHTIKGFKAIIKQTYKTLAKTRYVEIAKIAKLCSAYFEIRFNKSYDVENLHRFKFDEFPLYLKSILVSYIKAEDEGDLESFISDFYLWLGEVREGEIKYTLPKNVVSIYFALTRDEYDLEKYAQRFEEIWDILYEYGYHLLEINDISYCDLKPVQVLHSCDKLLIENDSKEVIFTEVCKILESEIHEIVNPAFKSRVKNACFEWLELTQEPTYDLFRTLAISNNPSLRSLTFIDDIKLPEGTLFKSLIFYVIETGKIEEVEFKLETIFKELKYLDSQFSDIQSIYGAILDRDCNELELIEVLLYYVDKYEEVACGHSWPLVTVE